MRDRARSGPPPTYSANQAAALLEVPANTIRKWRRTGRAAAAGQLPVPGGVEYLFTLDELRPLAEAYHARRGRTQ